MEIKKEQIEQIVNFGAFGYDCEKIANILGLDVKKVIIEMNNKQSELSLLLQKGVDMSDYVIDLKLFEMAKGGDLKALDKFNLRKSCRIQNKQKK